MDKPIYDKNLNAPRNEQDALLSALEADKDAKVLEGIPEALRGNRDFMVKAITISGAAIRYASKELRADKELVLLAAKERHFRPEYADESLQHDHDVWDMHAKTIKKARMHDRVWGKPRRKKQEI